MFNVYVCLHAFEHLQSSFRKPSTLALVVLVLNVWTPTLALGSLAPTVILMCNATILDLTLLQNFTFPYTFFIWSRSRKNLLSGGLTSMPSPRKVLLTLRKYLALRFLQLRITPFRLALSSVNLLKIKSMQKKSRKFPCGFEHLYDFQ